MGWSRDVNAELTIRFGSSMTGVAETAWMGVLMLVELLDVSGSVWLAVTVALFVNAPDAVGVTTMVTITAPPLLILPRVQFTGPLPLHEPWVVADETKVIPVAGKVSTTVTLVAVAGPLFVTVKR